LADENRRNFFDDDHLGAILSSSCFTNTIIDQYSSNRRIDTVIGVRYDDATKIEDIVKDINEMLHAHDSIDGTQTIMVHFTQFDASSLNINLYAFTKTTDWAKYRDVQQDVFIKTIGIIRQHGAECAFPTTTMHVPEPVSFHAETAQPR
jgi:MscS family membrane protein